MEDTAMNYWLRRQVSRRKMLRAGVLGGAGLWATSLIGCTTGEPSRTEPTPSAGQETKAKTGGVLNIRRPTSVTQIDPHKSPVCETSYGLVYESLVSFSDEKEYGTFEIRPYLAESWEQPDDVSYIFRVRKGVKWQNLPPVNGRELTAEDIVFSLKRLTRPDPVFVYASLLEEMASVEAADKYTVKMTTSTPSYPFLTKLATPDGSIIIPREIDETAGNTAIGTGPFILKEFERDKVLKMTRNPDYWQAGKPYLDGVNLNILSDAAAVLAALRTGHLDLADVAYQQVEALRSTNPDMAIEKYPGFTQLGIGLQHKRPPFSELRMRKAVQLALNLQEFIDIMANGQGKPNTGYWWWSEWALPQEYAPKQDLAKARQLIQEAGYSGGVKVEAPVPGTPGSREVEVFQIAKDQLAKVGIDVDIQVEEFAKYRARTITQFDFDMYTYEANAHEVPERFHKLFTYGPSAFNRIGVSDPDFDRLIIETERTMDRAKRKQLFFEFQKLFLERPATIFLYTPYAFTAQQPYVKGYKNSVSRYGRYRTIANWWLDK